MDLESSPKVIRGWAISLQMEDSIDFTNADSTCCCASSFVVTHWVNNGTVVAIVKSDFGNAAPCVG